MFYYQNSKFTLQFLRTFFPSTIKTDIIAPTSIVEKNYFNSILNTLSIICWPLIMPTTCFGMGILGISTICNKLWRIWAAYLYILDIAIHYLPIAVYKSSMTKSAWWVGSIGASWPEIFFQPDNSFLLWKVVLLNNLCSNIITLDYNVAIYCVLKAHCLAME